MDERAQLGYIARMPSRIFWIAPFTMIVACSSSSSAPETTDSGGGGTIDSAIADSGADTATTEETSADVGVDATDTGPSCSKLENVGEVVEEMKIAATKPAWTGGTVVDGTYVLTAFENYSGPGGATGPTGQKLRFTLVLTSGGTHGEVASEVVGKSSTRSSFDVVPTTTSPMTWQYSCPTTKSDEPWEFIATADTLVIGPPGTRNRLVFTKK